MNQLAQLVGVAAIGGAVYYYREPLKKRLFKKTIVGWGVFRKAEHVFRKLRGDFDRPVISPLRVWLIRGDDCQVELIKEFSYKELSFLSNEDRLCPELLGLERAQIESWPVSAQLQIEYLYRDPECPIASAQVYRLVYCPASLIDRWTIGSLTGEWLDNEISHDYETMETNVPSTQYTEDQLWDIVGAYAGPNSNFGRETLQPVKSHYLYDLEHGQPLLKDGQYVKLIDPLLETSIEFR